MHPMRRRLLALTAILSALLFVAICLMWLRSNFVRDYAWVWLPWQSDAGMKRYLKLDADSGAGLLELSWKTWTAANRQELQKRNELTGQRFYHRTFHNEPLHDARFFGHYTGPTHTSIWFPYLSAALLTAFLPALWLIAHLRRRGRVKSGHCPTCGYDLRATPGRCPECGGISDQNVALTQS
jgi:hypothetical protein